MTSNRLQACVPGDIFVDVILSNSDINVRLSGNSLRVRNPFVALISSNCEDFVCPSPVGNQFVEVISSNCEDVVALLWVNGPLVPNKSVNSLKRSIRSLNRFIVSSNKKQLRERLTTYRRINSYNRHWQSDTWHVLSRELHKDWGLYDYFDFILVNV